MSSKESFREHISKPEVNLFISIAIPLLAFAVAWGVVTARLDENRDDITDLRKSISTQIETNQYIQVKLAEIQKDILYIRQELSRHTDN